MEAVFIRDDIIPFVRDAPPLRIAAPGSQRYFC